MGFRFRKSVKAGPFRINFSKSGIGYSVGGKGFRYTKKANGGTRTTYSIPGTGISYVEETGAKKKSRTKKKEVTTSAMPAPELRQEPIPDATSGAVNDGASTQTVYCSHCFKMVQADSKRCPNCGKPLAAVQPTNTDNKKKPFYKRWWFIVLVLFSLLGACGDSTDTPIPEESTVSTSQIAIEPTDPVEHATETIEDHAATESIIGATTDPTVSTTAAEATAPTAPPPVFNLDSIAPKTSKTSGTTYVLNTNTMKFHYSSCRSADKISAENRSSFTGTRTEVMAQGYSPCGNCDP